MHPVGIRSLAVAFPSAARTNDYWRRRCPGGFDAWEQKTLAKVFDPADPSPDSEAFDLEMQPFTRDPFRGTVERRALGPGESPLTLQQKAAEDALRAAGLAPEDVDLLICVSFLPEHVGIGDAPFLAARLGLGGTGFNLESACGGVIHALQTAAALVRAGAHRNVLVTVSCTYSRALDETNSLSWFFGDGAGAFVVGAVERGQGLLGVKSVHTAETCGAFYWDLVNNPDGAPLVRVRSGPSAGRILRDTSAPVLRRCCRGAAEAAGVELGDIDFFVFNTPVAWYHRFAARALDIDPRKTLTTYPRYANIGPALTTANLFEAASTGRIREGSLVLLYAVGSVSSAGAAVMRWGNAGLGPAPSEPLSRE